jgi:hypothetical protein
VDFNVVVPHHRGVINTLYIHQVVAVIDNAPDYSLSKTDEEVESAEQTDIPFYEPIIEIWITDDDAYAIRAFIKTEREFPTPEEKRVLASAVETVVMSAE